MSWREKYLEKYVQDKWVNSKFCLDCPTVGRKQHFALKPFLIEKKNGKIDYMNE